MRVDAFTMLAVPGQCLSLELLLPILRLMIQVVHKKHISTLGNCSRHLALRRFEELNCIRLASKLRRTYVTQCQVTVYQNRTSMAR
jgi:hypothetical protein